MSPLSKAHAAFLAFELDNRAPPTMGELSETLGVCRTRAHQLIQNLTSRGVLEKWADSTSRRYRSVLCQTHECRTHGGQMVHFLEPGKTKVEAVDLAVHLDRICRYTGAIEVSVLEHLAFCVVLARAMGCDAEALAYIAAHDLHEAYVGDMSGPMKQVLPEFKRRIEDPWAAHVHRSLGLQWPVPDAARREVEMADWMALCVEAEAHQLYNETLNPNPTVVDMVPMRAATEMLLGVQQMGRALRWETVSIAIGMHTGISMPPWR